MHAGASQEIHTVATIMGGGGWGGLAVNDCLIRSQREQPIANRSNIIVVVVVAVAVVLHSFALPQGDVEAVNSSPGRGGGGRVALSSGVSHLGLLPRVRDKPPEF